MANVDITAFLKLHSYGGKNSIVMEDPVRPGFVKSIAMEQKARKCPTSKNRENRWHRQLPATFFEVGGTCFPLCSLLFRAKTAILLHYEQKGDFKMADIHIRKLSQEDVEKLDWQIKKLEKETKEPWSRSKYVSMLINNAQKRATDIPVERNVEMLLKKQNEILTAHYAALNRILYLITNGDIPQGMNLLDKLSTPLKDQSDSAEDD